MATEILPRVIGLPLIVAFVVGVGAATQIAMIGALARERGAPEATFISMMGTVLGIAIVFAVRSLRGEPPLLPAPLDRLPMMALIGAASFALLVLALRGTQPYFAVTGLFAVAFLMSTALIVPRIGVGLFFITNAAGTLVGSTIFDQFGAFGAHPIPVTPMKLAGFAIVLAGIGVVRFAR